MKTIDWNIIKKSFTEDLPSQQRQMLDEWLGDAPCNKKLYSDAQYYYKNNSSKINLSDREMNLLWNKFIKTKKARRNLLIKISAVAASLIVGITIAVMTPSNNIDSPEIASSGVLFQVENSAEMHQLKGNSKLIITKEGIKELSQDGRNDSEIIKLKSAEISYATTSTQGEIYNMTLEDGTKVWLNKNSKIRFPLVFSGDTREVSVEGEAYFEVSHNPVKPFIVSSKRVSVKVLGTKFNFQSGSDNTLSSTTLVDGSVQMTLKANNKTVILTPGTQGTENGDKITVKNVDITTLTAWTISRLILKDANIDDIAHILEVQYGVEVIISGKIDRELRYSLYTDINSSLDEVINAIKRIGEIDVDIIDHNIIVFKAKK